MDQPELDDRKAAILKAVVEEYVETAQPVGSQAIALASGLGVSSATVRNEMTVLEREGYLMQPHTSAGRIPTEKGYRYFVDAMGDPGELDVGRMSQVSQYFDHAHGELEEMLKSASRLLSRMTATTAVVVGEPDDASEVRSIQMVELSTTTLLVVAVLSSGTVLKRTIERPGGVDPDVLARAGAAAAQHAVNRVVTDLGTAPTTGDPAVDLLVADAFGAVTAASGDDGHQYFLDGASNIADAFAASETLREVLVILEQQLVVVSLLRDVLERGLTVAIGSETGVAPLAECSLVVAPFTVAGQRAGTIGVLGPTRMNYRDTLAAVSAVSNRLSSMLTDG
jgi:heat-inducible transcriptional repressor